MALAAAGLLASFSDQAEAQQMRTSRGARPLYPSGEARVASRTQVPISVDGTENSDDGEALDRETGEVVQASATQPVRRVTKSQAGKPSQTVTTSGVRPSAGAQGGKVVSARTTSSGGVAGPRRTGTVPAQAMEPIPQMESHGDESGCASCDSGMMMDGNWDGGGGCSSCGSCDGMGCDCGFQSRSNCCMDFGSGPLASVLSWGLTRSYLRFQAASFKPTGADLPILASTDGTNNTTALATLLVGNERVNDQSQVGFRFTAGLWLDPSNDRAIELQGFNAGTWEYRERIATGTNANIQRPFTGSPRVIVSGAPVTGAMEANMDTVAFGGTVHLRNRLYQACNRRVDFLVGYQHARLEDHLTIASTSNNAGPGGNGTVTSINDQFITRNRFDGMTLGLQRFSRWRYWSFDTRFRLGTGNLRRTIDIAGSDTTRVLNATTNRAEGLLARQTNSGVYVLDRFVVSPEFAFEVGYNVTRNLDFTLGYTYLGIPKVARAGDQIDVDANNIPETNVNFPAGAALPVFNLVEKNYSLHSFDFGAQWRF